MAAANLASTLATRAAASSSSSVQAATTTTTTADSALTEADSSDIQGGSGRRQLRSGRLKRKRSLEVINDIAGTASAPSLGRHSKHASTSVDDVSLQTSFADKSNGRLTRSSKAQQQIKPQPSAKLLGKRRAISPSLQSDASSDISETLGRPIAKKRAQFTPSSSTFTPSYNLRSRGSTSSFNTSPGTSAAQPTKKPRLPSSANTSPIPVSRRQTRTVMARKGKGSGVTGQHANSSASSSLRARAAANAAVQAAGTSLHPSNSASGANSGVAAGASSKARRQRDADLDVEEMLGFDDEDMDQDDVFDDDDELPHGASTSQNSAAARPQPRRSRRSLRGRDPLAGDDAEEDLQSALDSIAAFEAAEAAASAERAAEGPVCITEGQEDLLGDTAAVDAALRAVQALRESSIESIDADIPGISHGMIDMDKEDGFIQQEHDEDDENDEDMDDDDEGDEIGPDGHPAGDGDMMDDDFDAPLTFDADGNPLPEDAAADVGSLASDDPLGAARALLDALAGGSSLTNGTTASTAATTAPPAAGSDSSSNGDEPAGRPAGSAAGQTGSLRDDDFGSFAASLRGYSGMMSGMTTRLRTLLTDLRNKTDPSIKMTALQELSELLSMSTEDTLAGYFSVDAFVKEFVGCLRGSEANDPDLDDMEGEMDPDMLAAMRIAAQADAAPDENTDEMQLLACRCLANLIEAMPHTAHNIVGNGAVPVLCSKLTNITFIDLAEQTISTLEKLSEEMPNSIVRDGGLSALLTYLDFFSTHVQRNALVAVAHCCRNLTQDAFSSVKEAMPILRNVLSYSDRKLVEQACLAITRVVESYRHHPEKLETLLTADLLTAITALLVPGSANSTIEASTQPKILKLLGTAAKSSPDIAVSLIEMNIANIIYQLLTGTPPPLESAGIEGIRRHLDNDDMLVLNNLVHRSKDLVQETLSLTSELMPALPKDGIFDPKAHMHRSSRSKVKQEEAAAAALAASHTAGADTIELATGTSRRSRTASSRNRSPERRKSGRSTPNNRSSDATRPVKTEEATPALEDSSAAQDALSTAVRNREAAQAKRIELFEAAGPENSERRSTVQRFCALLLPTLLDVYSASVGVAVRSKTFQSMLKMVQYSSIDYLPTLLTIVPMANFLSSCLNSKDQLQVTVEALQMTELLLTRVPELYQFYFRREGVLHQLESMSQRPLLLVKTKKPPAGTTDVATASSAAGTPSAGPSTPVDEASSVVDIGIRALTSGLHGFSAAGQATTKPSASTTDAFYSDSITLRSKHLRKLMSDTKPGAGSQKADDNLARIRGIVEELSSVPSTSAGADEERAKNVLSRIASLFATSDAMSSYEMQEGGLIGGLLRFAAGDDKDKEAQSQRRRLISQAFMHGEGSGDAAFISLVRRLQEALGKAEQFDVVSALPSGGDNRQNPAGMLARQLKVRLVADEASGIPKSVSNVVVSIHAIATFQALNDYLRPKITRALAAADRSGNNSPVPTATLAPTSTSSRLNGMLAALAAATGMPAHPSDGSATSNASARASLLNALAASSAAASTATPGPTMPDLTRRRSSRLSARANGQATAASADTSMDQSQSRPPSRNLTAPEDVAAMQATEAEEEERPVNVEVAEDGSRVNASTPDGTRVQTPLSRSANGAAGLAPDNRPGLNAARSYAAALKAAPSDWHIEFLIGGKPIKADTTVFGSVYQHELRSNNPAGIKGIWHNVYTVTFSKRDGAPPAENVGAISTGTLDLDSHLPPYLEADPKQADMVRLLGLLHRINEEFADALNEHSFTHVDTSLAVAPLMAFVNNKLTAKLNRQLEEPMIVASKCLPDWAVSMPTLFPFLFPFETRFVYLQSTSFGYGRLMQKWLTNTRSDSASRRDSDISFLGRLQRQKVRISRQRLLESAFKVFDLYASSKAMLEVEYFDEVGTGLGPTLEFYALLSKEFRKVETDLWRLGDTAPKSEYYHSSSGLFPAPLSPLQSESEDGQRRLKTMKTLGTVVAKALMDSRILDLPFNRAFMQLVLQQELPLNLASVKVVDPLLASSLESLQKYLEEAKLVREADIGEENEAVAISEIAIDGARLEDLALDFMLPGHDIELKAGGRDVAVNIENLEEYIQLVITWTLRDGVTEVVNSFKSGFSDVFPVRDLHLFTADELIRLFGNENEDWTVETISEAIKADHGYSSTSISVTNFISIISDFDTSMQRQALSFFTGASRLPIGGFGGLNPPLTIVRKPAESGMTSDDVLPSVMTCANFIKLPDYSSKEVMRERLLTAIQEGGGAFHLS